MFHNFLFCCCILCGFAVTAAWIFLTVIALISWASEEAELAGLTTLVALIMLLLSAGLFSYAITYGMSSPPTLVVQAN